MSDDPTPTPTPTSATRREWIGLAVISLPCVVYSMDLTVLDLAIPALSRELMPGSAQLLWILDIYGFMVAGALITMGTLGDRIGRRRLLLIGAAAFGLASIVAASSRSAGTLIAARALLGLAGATLAPSTLSLIRNMFHEPGERRVAVSVWVMSYSVGGAMGPLIGGALLEHFPWGSVFLPSVPVMALLLLAGPRLLPEYRDPEAGRLDLSSAGLSLVAILAVIYGLKRIAEHGVGPAALGAISAGLAAGTIFVRRQARLDDPLIDLRLFRVPAFRASLAVYALACFVAFGSYVAIAQYLQLVLGLSPLRAGLWMLPWSLGFVAGSLLSPAVARRVPAPRLMAVGLLGGAVGFVVLSRAGATAGLAVLAVGTLLFSLGLRSRVHPRQRHDHRVRSGRARRRGGGDLGDGGGARRRSGHRRSGQRRHGRLSHADGRRGAARCPRRAAGRRARNSRRRRLRRRAPAGTRRRRAPRGGTRRLRPVVLARRDPLRRHHGGGGRRGLHAASILRLRRGRRRVAAGMKPAAADELDAPM